MRASIRFYAVLALMAALPACYTGGWYDYAQPGPSPAPVVDPITPEPVAPNAVAYEDVQRIVVGMTRGEVEAITGSAFQSAQVDDKTLDLSFRAVGPLGEARRLVVRLRDNKVASTPVLF